MMNSQSYKHLYSIGDTGSQAFTIYAFIRVARDVPDLKIVTLIILITGMIISPALQLLCATPLVQSSHKACLIGRMQDH